MSITNGASVGEKLGSVEGDADGYLDKAATDGLYDRKGIDVGKRVGDRVGLTVGCWDMVGLEVVGVAVGET